MVKIKWLLKMATALAVLAALACGASSTSPSDSTPVADVDSGSSAVVSTPVPRSDVATAFEKPLSSGLSVADVVENALPSVVHIIADSGTGTGFIINEDGLLVTNKHVVEESSQVAVRFVNGNEYQARVTWRHPDLIWHTSR